ASKYGHLLINFGPRADGSVPALQSAALEQPGEWPATHGEATYGTRPGFHDAGTTPADGMRSTLGTTRGGSPVLHALLLDPAAGAVTLDAQVTAATREIAERPLVDGPGGFLLSPDPRHGAVSVVTIPLREMPAHR